jgi:tRNA (guanosine-2'-O-)-methyltransferase
MPGAACNLDEVDVARPCALVFGNEHAGLSPAAQAAWPRQFAIPMYGFTRSFNLSVSVAVAVHHLAARRRAALGARGDLGAEERAVLRARWYAQDVRGAAEIVARYVSKQTRPDVVRHPQELENT